MNQIASSELRKADWSDLAALWGQVSTRKNVTAAFNEVLATVDPAEPLRQVREAVRTIRSPEGASPDIAGSLPSLSREERIRLVTAMVAFHDPVRQIVISEKVPLTAEDTASLHGLEIKRLRKALRASESEEEEQIKPFKYQESILRYGSFQISSPCAHRKTACDGSLAVITDTQRRVRPFLVYSFFDAEPFFVCVNPLFGYISGIYFPQRNIFIQSKSSGDTYVLDHLKALFAEFYQLTKRGLGLVEKKLAITYGVLNQIGHTILNELEAVHQCAVLGLLKPVEVVLQGWASFIQHGELFPELANKTVLKAESTADAYELTLKHGLMLVRPTCRDYWFSTELRKRFQSVGQDQRHIKSDAVTGMLETLSRCEPVIWIELKNNRRHWINQVEGFASIINKLRDEYPRLGVMLAGWSRFNDGRLNAEDEKMIRLDHAVAAGIKERVHSDVIVVDTTGVTTLEKVALSVTLDAFVAVHSSGVVFPAGIAGKSGVIHASQAFRNFARKKRRDGLDFIEDCATINYVDFDKVVDCGEARRWWASDYDLPWEEIYRPLDTLLKLQFPQITNKSVI